MLILAVREERKVKEITATGQSVDVAIESALSQLNATKDQVDIKIIDEGKKDSLVSSEQGLQL